VLELLHSSSLERVKKEPTSFQCIAFGRSLESDHHNVKGLVEPDCGLTASTVVFRSNRQSRVTHLPIDIEIWQGSRVTRPFVEPPERHTWLKFAYKTQKSQNFHFNVKNFAGVTPNFGCCRNVELIFWVTRRTQCRFELNTTVYD
jgi:hypothetical protein